MRHGPDSQPGADDGRRETGDGRRETGPGGRAAGTSRDGSWTGCGWVGRDELWEKQQNPSLARWRCPSPAACPGPQAHRPTQKSQMRGPGGGSVLENPSWTPGCQVVN